MELVIEGNVLYDGRVQKLALGIENGLIVDIRKTLKGVRVADFGEKLVFPGAIDAHVHLREPGLTHKEDFATGTTAAACGGVTTVLDMPNTKPSTVWPDDVKDKLSLAKKKACVDVGLFAGLAGKGRPEKLAGLVVGYKLYMGSTTGDLLMDDYARLPELLAPLAATGLPVAVHAEHQGMLRKVKLAPRDVLSYNDARPPECEAAAVAAFLSSLGENRGHVCHVSSRGALEALGIPFNSPEKPAESAAPVTPAPAAPAREPSRHSRLAAALLEGEERKAAGEERPAPSPSRRVTCEVAPHHLLLDARDNASLGTRGKVNPPLRKREEREALWNAFFSGGIDLLASDHAPHLEEEKDAQFEEAPAGVPGVETMVPLMMLLVKKGRLEASRLAAATCTRPAEVYSLQAGRIAKGMPAHLAVYDFRSVRVIRGKKLNSKCAWSPYEGREAIFPRAVFLRGVPVVEDGEPIVSPGTGRTIKSG